MTEKEKMLGGEFYDTRDIELRTLSNYAKDLMRIYNNFPWYRKPYQYELHSFRHG